MLISHLALTVREPPQSTNFYLSVIGLEGHARAEPWGSRLELRDGFMLALIQGEPLPADAAATVHFGCALLSRDDALEVRERLRRAGVTEVDAFHQSTSLTSG